MSADKKPTLYQVVPKLLKLDNYTQNVEYDPATICKVKEKMRTELEKRRQDKDLILLGCILNPSTKCLEFLRKEEKAKTNTLQLEQVRQRVQSPLAVKREKDGEVDVKPPLPSLPFLPENMEDEVQEIPIKVEEPEPPCK